MLPTLNLLRTFMGAWMLLHLQPALAQDQWPLRIQTEKSTITIYQPQPETYTDGKVTARAAVALQERGKDPIYGAIWFTGFLEVDRDTRMGTLTRLVVSDVKSPAVTDTTRLQRFKDFLSTEIPKHTQPFAIDRLIASLDDGHGEKPAFKHDPPRVFFEETPSTLVLIDGEPILQPIEGTNYQRVVNTPFLMATTKDAKIWYLGSTELWYTSSAATGPWSRTTHPPDELVEKVSKQNDAGTLKTTDAQGKLIVPKIVVSTKPAELLQTEGPADLQPIQGTQLLYVTNTDNDLFMDIASQQFYALLSGRWFTSPKLGPDAWTYIDAEKLPADFALIPEGSTKDGVLASVPGTQAAKEAVLDASIPQTAKVDRNATTTITYDGDPKWRLIEGTAIYEAENASTSVLYIRERYYACDNAVWYESDQAKGPWTVCTQVPAEVKDIPPSSPNYNVKYVQVYDSTPDVVYVGYTPGYTGCYVYGPTVIYGTGYYYQPWYGTVYYPPPVTWGFNMHYNPWTGWSMGVTVSNGWLTVGIGGYPGGWWGPPMYRPPYYPPPHYGHGGGYYGGRGNNNTINIDNSTNINVDGGNKPGSGQGGTTKPGGGAGGAGQANRPSQQPARGNLYDQGKKPGVQPSKPTTGTGTSANPSTGNKGGNYQTGGGSRGNAPGGANNNMYTDKQGNVYRNNGSNWQQQQGNGRFKDVPPSSGQAGTGTSNRGGGASMSPDTRQQLSRDQQSRARGQQRVNSYQSTPRGGGGYGGGGRSAGSMGGGARGGGGRR